MKLHRVLTHLLTGDAALRRGFPPATLQAIGRAIAASEAAHGGQIRFVVEGGLDGLPLFRGQTARQRAVDLFSDLRVWDTAGNNGLLIYLLLADRAVEIVCDRALHTAADTAACTAICRQMETEFRQGRFEAGALGGVQAVAQHLAPLGLPPGSLNELPDAPLLL